MTFSKRLVTQPHDILFSCENCKRLASCCIDDSKLDRIGSDVYGGELQLPAVFSAFLELKIEVTFCCDSLGGVIRAGSASASSGRAGG